MKRVKVGRLIELGDQNDALAREVLLVHGCHAPTGTCSSCGRSWPCDRAIDARRYAEYWQAERPRLVEHGAVVIVP